MKNKTMTKWFFSLAALGLLSPLAMAGPSDLTSLQVQDLNKSGNSQYVDITSTMSCAKLYYVGTATEAAVGVTGTYVQVQAPFGTNDATGSGQTSGEWLYSTYTTMGSLCTSINGSASYRCVLTGCKQGDVPGVQGAVAASGGTSGTNAGAVGGYDTVFSSGEQSLRLGINPLPLHHVVLKSVICNGVSAGSGRINVFGRLQKFNGNTDGVVRNDNTKVWSQLITSGVASGPAIYDVAVTTGSLNSSSTSAVNYYIPTLLNQEQNGWRLEFADNLSQTNMSQLGSNSSATALLNMNSSGHVVIECGGSTDVQTSASSLQVYWDEK